MAFRQIENTPNTFVLNQKIESVFYRLDQLTDISKTLLYSVANTKDPVVKEYALRFEILTKQLGDILAILEPIKTQFETKENSIESFLLFVPFEALKVIDEGLWKLETDGPNASKIEEPHEKTFVASISGVTSIINEVVRNFESLIDDQEKLAA